MGAGQKAWQTRRLNEAREEAHRVRDLIRDRYSNPTKDRIRSWIVAEIRAVQPTLVLDLWGGGLSAEEMTAAGLSVLSVDRADGFSEHHVSAEQGKSALAFCGQESGYRTGWVPTNGSVSKFARECDAAWWDFMGHLAPDKIRALKASRHMKMIVVTLMADRMKGADDWTAETWSVMYEAAIEHYSGLTVKATRKYQRAVGSWVLVFVARRQIDARARERARSAVRFADPEQRAKLKAYQAAYHSKNAERLKASEAARWADPEVRTAQRERARVWYAKPENKAALLARQAAKRKEPGEQARQNAMARVHYATHPEVREKRRAWKQEKMAAEPAYRERIREQMREWQQRPEVKARRNELQRARLARKRAEAG